MPVTVLGAKGTLVNTGMLLSLMALKVSLEREILNK